MSDTPESVQVRESPGEGGTDVGRAFGPFFVAALATSACIWTYRRVGAGAAGIPGLVLLATPLALLIAAFVHPRLRRLARPAWAGLVAGVVLPYVLVSFLLPEWASRRPFDPVTWKAVAGGRAEDRLHQVDALVESGTLDLRTRSSVLDLLGPDDSAAGTGWARGYFADWGLVYWLGAMRGFIRIDSEWLVIRFDGAGVVQEYRIVND